jgi:ElaB/YqjD/DUF883 family membrane-anchored ribosome-binding protein
METTTKTTSTSSRTSPQAERKAQDTGTEIQRSWSDASSAIETLYTQASRELQHTVKERPYVALGVAAGIGFVLGGGLRSVTGRYLIRTTAQLVVPGVLAALRGEAD